MRKKWSILLLIVVFFNNYTTSQCQRLSEQEYAELSKIFAIDFYLDSSFSNSASVAQYESKRPKLAFEHSRILDLTGESENNRRLSNVLIIVNKNINEQLSYKIKRYAYDINLVYGANVILEEVQGGSCFDIKNLILLHQSALSGVVFIGDISSAWYETENDHQQYGYKTWPCDLFYMDLDGVWEDKDENGIFDSHTGNVQPEVFVGRISTKDMGTLISETDALSSYFDKNHDFWMGKTIVQRKYGLSYTDKSWISHGYFKTDIKDLYGQDFYDSVAYGAAYFGKNDFLNRLRNHKYEFIQLACHASPTHLAMTGKGIYSKEIYDNKTVAIGYNLFCCSACNWTAATEDQGFLAGSFIYNSGKVPLVVVGSTKTGSMLSFRNFYGPLGQGKSIGEALQSWWVNTFGSHHTNSTVSWHYGMTIIGDPLVNFYHCDYVGDCVDRIVLNSFDGTNPVSCRYVMANEEIVVNDYVIPSGFKVVFKAKKVTLNKGFRCMPGGMFEIINEGCTLK